MVDDTAVRFADAVRDAYERAVATGVESAKHHALTLAERPVTLAVAGSTLDDTYFPALAHLATDTSSEPADLFVGCWERASTGAPPPPPPWALDDFLPRGRIRGLVQDRIRVTYDDPCHLIHGQRVA